MGIEPTLSAWKAEVLPLNYTRDGGDTIIKLPDISQEKIVFHKKT